MIRKTSIELCFLLCGAFTLGLYLRGCLRLGSPLKQMPTREILFIRCLCGIPMQDIITNFSHIRWLEKSYIIRNRQTALQATNKQQKTKSSNNNRCSGQAVAATNSFLPTRCFRVRLRGAYAKIGLLLVTKEFSRLLTWYKRRAMQNSICSIDYNTKRVCPLGAQEPVCQAKHLQTFDLKNQCAPIVSTNKLLTSIVAMPLQLIFLVFPFEFASKCQIKHLQSNIIFPQDPWRSFREIWTRK